MAPHSEGQNSKAHEPFYDTTASFFWDGIKRRKQQQILNLSSLQFSGEYMMVNQAETSIKTTQQSKLGFILALRHCRNIWPATVKYEWSNKSELKPVNAPMLCWKYCFVLSLQCPWKTRRFRSNFKMWACRTVSSPCFVFIAYHAYVYITNSTAATTMFHSVVKSRNVCVFKHIAWFRKWLAGEKSCDPMNDMVYMFEFQNESENTLQNFNENCRDRATQLLCPSGWVVHNGPSFSQLTTWFWQNASFTQSWFPKI